MEAIPKPFPARTARSAVRICAGTGNGGLRTIVWHAEMAATGGRTPENRRRGKREFEFCKAHRGSGGGANDCSGLALWSRTRKLPLAEPCALVALAQKRNASEIADRSEKNRKRIGSARVGGDGE